ncbi:MAG: hypothetical protein ACI901_001299 [Octadecabacter sp.]|jgi:hypothetical protein
MSIRIFFSSAILMFAPVVIKKAKYQSLKQVDLGSWIVTEFAVRQNGTCNKCIKG